MSTSMPYQEKEIKYLESSLLSNLDEKFFFKTLGHAVKENFSCDRVIIFKNIDDGFPVFVADSEDRDIFPYVMEQGKGVSGHVIRTSHSYYSNNVFRDPIFHGVKESEGYDAELCVPVIIDGQIMATVHLQNKISHHDFSQKHINQVKGFLNHLSRPLSNMQMYLTAKHLSQSLKKERYQGPIEGSPYAVQDFKIVGQCSEMNEVFNVIERLSYGRATTNLPPILIEGELGVGKESIAKKIHVQNAGQERPFVVVNVSLLTEDNFDTEMFGHARSASGRYSSKKGFCRIADKGTLFLDNIGELSLAMQVKLLTFLEMKRIYRVGSKRGAQMDVQVMASFNGNLQKEMESGRFREDLYFMFKGLIIKIPALREREGDIELLANFFLNKNKSMINHKQFSEEALALIKAYHWPGNVRELRNAMEMAYLMSEGKTIRVHHLPNDMDIQKIEREEDYVKISLEDLEKGHILKTLKFMKGNKTKTAKVLGITVKTLYNKLHAYRVIEPMRRVKAKRQVL